MNLNVLIPGDKELFKRVLLAKRMIDDTLANLNTSVEIPVFDNHILCGLIAHIVPNARLITGALHGLESRGEGFIVARRVHSWLQGKSAIFDVTPLGVHVPGSILILPLEELGRKDLNIPFGSGRYRAENVSGEYEYDYQKLAEVKEFFKTHAASITVPAIS